MSRLPRRSSRVKPPLRGRAATQHYRGEFAPVASVHRPTRPLYSPQKHHGSSCSGTEQPLTLYQKLKHFLDSLEPWKGLLILALLLSSLWLLNRLF